MSTVTQSPPTPKRSTAAAGSVGAYHHGRLREVLIEATIRAVYDIEPTQISLRQIARDAGVSEAAPYHHFADKAHLVGAAAARSYERFTEKLRLSLASTTAGTEPAIALAEFYVRFAFTRRGEFRLMCGAHIVDEGIDAQEAAVVASIAARDLMIDACDRSLAARSASWRGRDAFRVIWTQMHGVAALGLEKELGTDVEGAADLARIGVGLLLDGMTDR